jgi:hypothetical protein
MLSAKGINWLKNEVITAAVEYFVICEFDSLMKKYVD